MWFDRKLFETVSSFLVYRNICHGSDSVDTAKREIALWFQPDELIDWKPVQNEWLYE